MPTYEYICSECGKEFEVFHSIKAEPLTDCQLCGKKGSVRRKIGRGAGIIFKGTGFYETDFKDKKGKQGGVSPAPEKPKESKGSEANSSKKSETTASTSTKSSDSH